jgi:hypothetical protein
MLRLDESTDTATITGDLATTNKIEINSSQAPGGSNAGIKNTLNVYHTGADGDQGIMIIRDDNSVGSGNILGGIGFDSRDGNAPSSILEASAYIAAFADETQSTSDKGGRLTFGTAVQNDDQDTTSTEHMRIKNNGIVLIGRTSQAATSKDPLLEVDGFVSFDGFVERAGTGGSDNGGNIINFNWNGTQLEGWVDTTEVASNITSDYRIKENVTPIQDGVLDKINQLNPINYTQASCSIFPQITGSIKTSLIAHELQEVFPDLVIGEKDAMNEDGTPLLQKYDEDALTIYLLKAVQELSQKVDSLEAQLSGSR